MRVNTNASAARTADGDGSICRRRIRIRVRLRGAERLMNAGHDNVLWDAADQLAAAFEQ